MPDETDTIIVRSSVEEDRNTGDIVQDEFAVDNCSAKCPNCEQTCSFTAGHPGLHHCGNGHEWV